MSEVYSDAFVLFGATGDLAYKKIFPALHSMIKRGSQTGTILGVSRGGSSLEQLRERVRESIKEFGGGVDETAFQTLCKNLRYVDGDYRTPELFAKIREALGDAKRPLFYLSIPPSVFPEVVELLGTTGLSKVSRVVVEKPFGRDLASAKVLNKTLQSVFKETSIFRIDHFLGFFDPPHARGPVGEQYPVQMINLMLKNARHPARQFELYLFALAVKTLYLQFFVTLNISLDARDRETGFRPFHQILGSSNDFGVHQGIQFFGRFFIFIIAVFDDNNSL